MDSILQAPIPREDLNRLQAQISNADRFVAGMFRAPELQGEPFPAGQITGVARRSTSPSRGGELVQGGSCKDCLNPAHQAVCQAYLDSLFTIPKSVIGFAKAASKS